MARQKYKLPNDSTEYNVNVESEQGQQWLKDNPNAQLVGGEQGKTNDDAVDANATSTTPASNQETDQSQNNQQENTELQSEESSSDVRGTTFDAPIDVNNFETVVDKDEDAVVAAFTNSTAYPGLNVEKRGLLMGNAVDFTLPDGTVIDVDLKAFEFTGGRDKALSQINKVKEFYENKENQDLVDLGVFDALGQRGANKDSFLSLIHI